MVAGVPKTAPRAAIGRRARTREATAGRSRRRTTGTATRTGERARDACQPRLAAPGCRRGTQLTAAALLPRYYPPPQRRRAPRASAAGPGGGSRGTPSPALPRMPSRRLQHRTVTCLLLPSSTRRRPRSSRRPCPRSPRSSSQGPSCPSLTASWSSRRAPAAMPVPLRSRRRGCLNFLVVAVIFPRRCSKALRARFGARIVFPQADESAKPLLEGSMLCTSSRQVIGRVRPTLCKAPF